MDDFGRVKSAIDFIRYAERSMTLKRSGATYKALCIFHDDRNPSMHIYPDSYHCYVCGANGDIFDLHMKLNNCTKAEALVELARYANIELTPLTPERKAKEDKRERLYALMDFAARLYMGGLSSVIGDRAREYLKTTRGLSDETIQAAMLGYAPNYAPRWLIDRLEHHGYSMQEIIDSGLTTKTEDGQIDRYRNRVTIPIRDSRNRVIGFSGRALSPDQTPKYLYNTGLEKSANIHAMPLKQGIQAFSEVIAVEGSLDPISALNCGLYNIASIMGSSLSEMQLSLLAKTAPKIIFCMDNDAAGQAATKRLAETYLQAAARLGVELYVMHAPYGKDPDDTFREHPEMWEPAVDSARPLVDVLIEMSIGALPQNATATQKSPLVKKLMSFLRNDDPLVTRENIGKLATALNVSAADLEVMERVTAMFTVLPRNAHVKPTISHLPSIEEWVLHGIIANDDDGWLERANACLLVASTDNLLYALAPLSINDFKGHKTKAIWTKIAEYVKERLRPVYDPMEMYVKDTPMQEQYERLRRLDITSRELGYPCEVSYETFIDNIYQLRINRLKEELPELALSNPERANECRIAIACLMLAQEELV